jgi:hypothetical protein
MNRKYFLFNSIASTTAFMIHPFSSIAQTENPPPYSSDVVKEFVAVGHNNLPRVKEMLVQYPNLLYCRYDWGNGDFEEAIEGAGHVGNKDIANYLIEKGARPNIYVLTMLGETEIVKSILTKFPNLINGLGPHGFTLLHHAMKGGDASKELLEYFKEKGLKETRIKI